MDLPFVGRPLAVVGDGLPFVGVPLAVGRRRSPVCPPTLAVVGLTLAGLAPFGLGFAPSA